MITVQDYHFMLAEADVEYAKAVAEAEYQYEYHIENSENVSHVESAWENRYAQIGKAELERSLAYEKANKAYKGFLSK